MSAIIQLAGSALAVGLTLGLFLTPLARRFAPASLIDHPGERKEHRHPLPAAGGLAIFWSFALPTLLLAAVTRSGGALPGGGALGVFAGDAPLLLTLVAGAALVHVTGLVDDSVGLGPVVKLIAELIAATPLVLAFDVVLLPRWLDPALGVVLTLAWFLAVTNAFNFLDGMDGLMAAVAVICAAELMLVAGSSQQFGTVALLALLIGGLLGFLWFNWPPASIFSGDSGSLPVGFLLAFFSVRITYAGPGGGGEAPWHAVLAPLLILAIPLYDLTSVVAIRLVQGRSPLAADRQHFSHRLRRRGLSTREVLLLVCAFTFASGVGGVLLIHLDTWQAALVVAQALFLLAVLARLEWISKESRRPPGSAPEDQR